MNVFTILPICILALCLILSCCGYILSERQERKRRQTHMINEFYAAQLPEQVFTIDVLPIQLPTADSSLPPYETGE